MKLTDEKIRLVIEQCNTCDRGYCCDTCELRFQVLIERAAGLKLADACEAMLCGPVELPGCADCKQAARAIQAYRKAIVPKAKTQQRPDWLPDTDRVYAQVGPERRRLQDGRLNGINARWLTAFDCYTGDRSDGPVSLMKRKCPNPNCSDGRSLDLSKSYDRVIACHRCKPYGGKGFVYEIQRDWLLSDPATVEVLRDPTAFFSRSPNVYGLRHEIDERECETCSGWDKDCSVCRGTGKLPAREYVMVRSTERTEG